MPLTPLMGPSSRSLARTMTESTIPSGAMVVPSAYVTAAEAVQSHMQIMDRTAREQWQRYKEAIAADLLVPLCAVIEQATASHDQLLAVWRLDEAGPDLWQRTVAYREAAVTGVAGPVRAELARLNRGDLLGEGARAMLSALAPLVEDTMPVCTLPCPEALFDSAAGDGLIRALRKMGMRVRRRMRRLWPASAALPLPGRWVPVHALWEYHVHKRLGTTVAVLHEQIQGHVATITGRLEVALTDWTHATLDAEHRLDRLGHHQPAHAPDVQTDHVPHDIEAFTTSARALQEVLDRASGAMVFPELDDTNRFDAASRELAQDFKHAGTFMLRERERVAPPLGQRAVDTIEQIQGHWTAWHTEVVNRMVLNEQVAGFRKTFLSVHDTILASIADVTLRPLQETFAHAAGRLRKASQAIDAAVALTRRTALADTLRALQEEVPRALQEDLGAVHELIEADQVLARPGGAVLQMLDDALQALPASVSIHAPPREEQDISPDRRYWQMPVRQGIREMFPSFDEDLAEHVRLLRDTVVRIWNESEQAIRIVEFNLGAALEELDATDTGISANNARELAADGLRRAAELLMELTNSLGQAWGVFANAVFLQFQQYWANVHRATRGEVFIEQRWSNYLMRFRRQAHSALRWRRAAAARVSRQGWRLIRHGRRQARMLLEQGRTAIGTAGTDEADRLRTIDAISACSVHQLHARMPLVYQRLFALQPVTEPSLLEGRNQDLEHIRRHVWRWREGHAAGALVVPMPLGSGRTSLVNVVKATFSEEIDVHLFPLEERVTNTRTFAAHVAAVLGIDDGAGDSLETLEAALLAAPPGEFFGVCLIENLEHLLLRTAGGSDVMEQVLIFFSRTDARVCWIATMGDAAWRFLEATIGAATGLVAVYRPIPLNCETLQNIIINRHQRSGLKLRFAEPKTLPPLQRRRLRRARTEEATQQLLRGLYFDRLYQYSGVNVMLALYYWLQSAEYDKEAGVLTMKPIAPLDFRFFESFGMARTFTMKAFLLHNTLSLEEHNRIFRMADADSIFLLESLLNLRLIVACSGRSNQHIIPGVRYQLNPIILHPAMLLLRERNVMQ